MTDKELLELCHDAFKASHKAADCRKMLKKRLGIVPSAYAGSGQWILAEQMAAKIRNHLGRAD